MPCNIPKHKLFSAFLLRPLRLCGENLRLNCGFRVEFALFWQRVYVLLEGYGGFFALCFCNVRTRHNWRRNVRRGRCYPFWRFGRAVGIPCQVGEKQNARDATKATGEGGYHTDDKGRESCDDKKHG